MESQTLEKLLHVTDKPNLKSQNGNTYIGKKHISRSICIVFPLIRVHVFIIYAAASLPLLFIDGAKLHGLNYWYALFPGAAGCMILCLLVSFLPNLNS